MTTQADFYKNSKQRDRAEAVAAAWDVDHLGDGNPHLFADYNASYGYIEIAARELGYELEAAEQSDDDDALFDQVEARARELAVEDGADLS